VPRVEFDVWLSFVLTGLFTPFRLTRDPTSGIRVGYLMYASPREVWSLEEDPVV
jgi:hypothetical protein